MSRPLHLGVLINPLAGLGGELAMKGSDGDALRKLAPSLDRGRSAARLARALGTLKGSGDTIRISTWGGPMGEELCRQLGFAVQVVGQPASGLTSSADTVEAASALLAAGIDLLLFAGGDGTARDVFDAVGTRVPVLGVPAGVKMHSAVFAVAPEAAGELLRELHRGGLVGLRLQEVRDIDEEAFREGAVRSRFYGEMQVPGEGRYLQHTKIGGRESAELVAGEIAAWIVENMAPGTTYLVGPGSTTAAIMEELGLDCTLLGVDVVRGGALQALDADAGELLVHLDQATGAVEMLVTAIGGQGHVFGRGNQQFTPEVIRRVGAERIQVVAAKSKISGLEGRPLLVDTNDPELDRELSGYWRVTTGYDDYILYPIGSVEEHTDE